MQVTAIGDVAALLGAAANGASLSIGRNLLQRPTNLPVWIYSAAVTGNFTLESAHQSPHSLHGCRTPCCSFIARQHITNFPTITGSAGVVLSFVAIPADGAIMAQAGAHGVFGWASAQYAVLGTYLGIGPGVVGHVGFNVLLLYLSPLVLTLAQTLDPPIGAFVGELALPQTRQHIAACAWTALKLLAFANPSVLGYRVGSGAHAGTRPFNVSWRRNAVGSNRCCDHVSQSTCTPSFAIRKSAARTRHTDAGCAAN